jgi:pSer/pThr/pTyr-binding forkhead associated (FHA) protein
MTRMICPVTGCAHVQHETARMCPVHVEDLVPANDEEPAQPAAAAQPPSRVHLSLSFPGGRVTVAAGEQVRLGRGAEKSPHAVLLTGHGNVSRLHATAGVDQDGGAWIRDEHSTNGTYINGQEIPAQPPSPIRNGDRLRFGADLTADVRIAEEPPTTG